LRRVGDANNERLAAGIKFAGFEASAGGGADFRIADVHGEVIKAVPV
jgi:hypothetical protein